MIQFEDPTELKIPFNQHLFPPKMRKDIQDVLMNNFIEVNYTNVEIATYYLSLQNTWRHVQRKIRVVFIVQSQVSCDKVLPVYEAMKERDDFSVSLVIIQHLLLNTMMAHGHIFMTDILMI